MKVLLIYPPCLEPRDHELYSEDVGITPIGLYYLGALLLENGHQVEILNWYDLNQDPGAIKDILAQKGPDVIGFSIVNANRFGGIDIARMAKEVSSGISIVFGGIGATFLWEHLLTNFPEIDYIVLGEGEYTFLDLVRFLESESAGDPGDIPGIAHRQNHQILSTPPRGHVQDLDQLPSPAKYFNFQHLISSRGCPFNCTFCGSPGFWGRKVRFHSPEYFVDQMEELRSKGTSFFYVSDDTFTLDRDRVIRICREILRRGLKVSWYAISSVKSVDAEVLYWMRLAGCIQISYGVESGSQEIRNSLNKKISNQEIKIAFDLTVSYGILARAYFIYGSPGESRATIQASLDLMDEIRPLSMVSYILEIFPGTALYEEFKQRTGTGDDIWLQRIEDIKYFEIDPELTPEMVLEFGQLLRTEYYRRLPGYADAIRLVDLEELYPSHAEFLSRLGMTFSHGDYASLEAIPDKEGVAERLYHKSLSYGANPRAYLGLGIILQKQGKYRESAEVLAQGTEDFPGHETLAACLCFSYINLGRYEPVLEYARRFPDSQRIQQYARACQNIR